MMIIMTANKKYINYTNHNNATAVLNSNGDNNCNRFMIKNNRVKKKSETIKIHQEAKEYT